MKIKGKQYFKTMFVNIYGPPGTKPKRFTIKANGGTGFINIEDQLLKMASDLEAKWPNMEFELKPLAGGNRFNFVFTSYKLSEAVEDGIKAVETAAPTVFDGNRA